MEGLNKRWRASLAGLFFMASTASALSLANFQVITSSSVSLPCIVIYDSPILGCTSADFTQGQTCSTDCQDGLGEIQGTLQAICGDPDISPQSVLGEALNGNLVPMLCPSKSAATTTSISSSTQAPSTTVAISTTARVTSMTHTTEAVSSTSPSTSDVSSTTAVNPSTASTSHDLSSTVQTSATIVSSSVVDTSSTGQTTIVMSTQTSTRHTSSGQSTSTAVNTAIPGSRGGGSPFDAAIASQSAQSVPTSWLESAFLLAAVAFLLR